MLANFLSRITDKARRFWSGRDALSAEVDAELQSHLDLQTQAHLEAGLTLDEASLAARRQLGQPVSVKERCREATESALSRHFSVAAQDLRFAFRQLAKHPGFTGVAMLTLAIGIGANTAIFSIINGVLLKPLPYPEPERLVTLWERNPGQGLEQDRVSGPNFLDWRAQNTTLADLAVSPGWDGVENFNLVLQDTVLKVRATYASSSLFSTLGVTPLLGRTLLPEEDRKEGPQSVVLGYDLWKRVYAGDSNILGRTLTLDTYGRRDYQIVGIMPPGFGQPGRSELWLPLGWMGVDLTNRRSARWHNVIARLKPGVSIERARAELNMIQARIREAHSGESVGTEVSVIPMIEQGVGRQVKTSLYILWGVVLGVLLIACANVANLLLARASVRQKEIALRTALGARRGRIVRQLLTESMALAFGGGLLGALLAWMALRLFVATGPGNIPRLNEVSLDASALVVTFAISVLTGILFGLAPAWQLSRPNLDQAMRAGSRGASGGPAASRARQLLVVAQVATCLVLLFAAGLMLQSFVRMLQADRGFRAEHLLTAELDFSVSGFTTWVRPTATRPQSSLKPLLDRIQAAPGVQSVAASSVLLRRENRPARENIAIFGRPALKPEENPKAEFKGITPGWVKTLGAQLLRGRDFTEADTLTSPGVFLVNETFARRYFPGHDAVGERIKMGLSQPLANATNNWGLSEWGTIVGVVSDIKSLHAQPEVIPEVFAPYWQWPMQGPTMIIRTTGDPALLAQTIRRETKALIPNLPPPVVRSMDERVGEALAQPKFQTSLLGLFAVVALLLAAIGLHAVVAYAVNQRAREIGIRMTLGAQRRDVLALVVGQGMRMTLLGVGIGVVLSLVVTRVMKALLYEVRPTDPFTLGGVALLLILVALLACCLPARRAMRLDPMVALRAE